MTDFINEEIEENMNYLFSKIIGLFPSTRSILKTQDEINHTKKVWCYGLVDAGIITGSGLNTDLFFRGCTCISSLNQKFMPSCGQFIHLCLYGLEKDEEEHTTMQDDNI